MNEVILPLQPLNFCAIISLFLLSAMTAATADLFFPEAQYLD